MQILCASLFSELSLALILEVRLLLFVYLSNVMQIFQSLKVSYQILLMDQFH